MRFLKDLSTLATGASLLALSCLLPTRVSAASFDSIYVFGDSLVDNGNFYKNSIGYNFGDQPPPFPGSSKDGYPGLPYDRGRFSNGPVFVEDLAPLLGLPTSSVHDYAVGGATSGYNHSDARLPPDIFPGTLTQVKNYTSQPADPKGLYIVSAGSNDYSITNPNFFTDPSVIPAAVGATVSNVDSAIEMLAKDGARNIIVVSVPDFGNIPGYTHSLPPSALSLLTNLANVHNSTLAASLQNLRGRLNATITLLDIASIQDTVINSPTKFGFTNATDPCLNPTTLAVCSDPNSYVFWDSSHPTATAHQKLAKYTFDRLNQIASVPEASDTTGILTFCAIGAGYLLKGIPGKKR